HARTHAAARTYRAAGAAHHQGGVGRAHRGSQRGELCLGGGRGAGSARQGVEGAVAPLRASITTRITLVVVGIHAVLLPAMYFAQSIGETNSHADLFIQNARTVSRNLAEQIETEALDNKRVVEILDLAMVHSESVYAELVDTGTSIKSSLNSPNLVWPGREDF